MSIHERLDQSVEQGLLVPYLHLDGREPSRRLYLADRLTGEVADPQSAIGFFEQRRAVVALFDRWVRGEQVHVRLAGRTSGCALARLEPPPPEIWEFRITEPRPQLRVFCRFAAPDVLVALLARNRDTLGPADQAPGRRSKAWKEAMYGCEAEWTRIFRGAEPFRGDTVRDYVSRNATQCP